MSIERTATKPLPQAPWLILLFPGLPAAADGEDTARRRVVLGIAALLAAPMVAYQAVISSQLGYTHIAALASLTSVLMLCIFLAVRHGTGLGFARLTLVIVIALQLLALVTAEGHFSLVWVMLIPLMTTFLFGRAEGLIWSAGVLLLFLGVLVEPALAGLTPVPDSWPWRGAIEDFAFAYALTAMFAVSYESLRLSALKRLHLALEEREQSEARMLDYNRIGTDLLFDLDVDLRVTHLSGSWSELTGVPIDDIMGLAFSESADAYTRSGWEPIESQLQARVPVRNERINFHFHDGRELTIQVRMDPCFDDQGGFTGYRGVGVDITDRVAADEDMRTKDRALQHATRMEAVGQLTSGVAHDFNNLLTVIMGNLELLESQLEESGLDTEELDQVAAAARRAADLTSKLLAFSRRQALKPTRIGTADLLDETAQLLARTLPETIRVLARPDAGVWDCRADKGQLESALLNLALNARDAMPEGGELELGAANLELDADWASDYEVGPGQYVAIRVRDSGVGMPPEMLDHVFEPFFTTKPTGRGTGLGLSMVYGFVRQSGGGVRITSAEGGGTTMELLLPRADGSRHEARDDAVASSHRGDGECVLVVEDEAGVRNLVVSMLNRLGYQAVAAATGPEGIALFREREPVLVISDVVLAGPMNGVDVVNAIRELTPGVPALFMSGYSDTVFRDQATLPAGVPLLPKPFGLADLQRSIESVIA